MGDRLLCWRQSALRFVQSQWCGGNHSCPFCRNHEGISKIGFHDLLMIQIQRATAAAKNPQQERTLQSSALTASLSRNRSRFIDQSSGFVSVAPFEARFPFETWIIPINHSSNFEETSDSEIGDLARLLHLTLKKIVQQFPGAPYNYVLYNNPFCEETKTEYFHWYIAILPRLGVLGGFELATGWTINTVRIFLIIQAMPDNFSRIAREVRDIHAHCALSIEFFYGFSQSLCTWFSILKLAVTNDTERFYKLSGNERDYSRILVLIATYDGLLDQRISLIDQRIVHTGVKSQKVGSIKQVLIILCLVNGVISCKWLYVSVLNKWIFMMMFFGNFFTTWLILDNKLSSKTFL
ncbi:hypothetical protein SELMODRAFT_423245 [Selaginella moellendorffii]|uniref:Galactose-1-phosphate uridyl transferase N-terminal domain-containing protein n=1 Tax=Selaginella moellendorffii TaxID=88036 RepID=D8SL18_SELML|nr:hypothetical protein SELMODRAFT_423245 [Selaginella moellendorffii]